MSGTRLQSARPRPGFALLSELGDAATALRALRDRYPGLAPDRLGRSGPAIVGAAPEGRRLVAACATRGIPIAALCDDNPALVGGAVDGVRVEPSARLAELDRDTPVLIASHRTLRATQRLRALGFRTVAPLGVFSTVAPETFPPHVFYAGWVEDLFTHRDRYLALLELLADEKSRATLDAIVAYRLTGDPTVLAPVLVEELYDPGELIRLGTDEVYVDAGAFDGDTVRLFIKRTAGRFERVYAFEPDPDTFVRLAANFRDEPRVVCVNQGLFDSAQVMYFDASGSRHSGLQTSGTSRVEVVDLDSVLAGGRATFVKMNIEAAEPAALTGARRTIERWKPRLAVSVYHLPSHVWQLPEQIRGLRSDYSFHLVQHDGGVVESTLYAL